MLNRLCFGVLLLWVLISILAQFFDLPANQIHLEKVLAGPSWQAILGYDDLGRDISARLIAGAQVSLFVSFTVVTISLVVGVLLGTLASYFGLWFDRVFVFVVDTFMAFPSLLLAMSLAAVMGPGIDNVMIALVVVGWVGFARIARAQIMSIKQQDHILVAHCLGSSHRFIMLKHIIPLIWAPLIIEASYGFASVMIAEAGLSFLGLGVQAPFSSWGNMIRDGSAYLLVAPHMVIAPGLALAAVVFAINRLGDVLNDYLNIKQHSRII